jgi:4-amino-4-deoxy-L-arabinose transferase-like glycosyltransferase
MMLMDAPATARPAAPAARESRRPRIALLVLLAGTAVLYLWDLGASGWANAYYSAAAQAGSQSWSAWFFGATDSANSITVDKTPASVWLTGLSVRIFGLNSWAILVPQALAGVASVALLVAAVRRWSTPAAGLLAGTVLALTPVAALMFRFNNPDALLVLLLIAGAYCTVRATEHGSGRWLALAGVAIGFGFLTKMLQALLVVPAFGLVYLIAAPIVLRRRIAHLALAAVAMVVAGGWWVAVVELIPAGSRPFVGGSQTNSVLELALGYNGIGRLNGDEVGSVGGGAGGGWGSTGWTRLLSGEMGTGIAWLLPASVVLLVAGLWVSRSEPRTGRLRAALILWGGWLLVTAVVFSYMAGIIHSYYTVALAPAIGAICGVGAAELWHRRSDPVAAAALAGAVALTALQSYLLLADYSTPLAVSVLFVGLVAAAGSVVAGALPEVAARAVAVLALLAALVGPTVYSVETVAVAHTGALPSVGPAGAGGFAVAAGGPRGGGSRGGGMGGLLSAPTAGTRLTALLRDADTTWAAAAVGSNNAAGYQLAADVPVMAVGGFNGTDPAPTLAEFQRLVTDGQIRYFIGGAGMSAARTVAATRLPRSHSGWPARTHPPQWTA